MFVPVGYDDKVKMPKTRCEFCNRKDGYVFDELQSEFKDVQYYILQENLEDVDNGFKPAIITCVLEDEQVNTIKPGDKVRVNGLVELRNKKQENRFKEYLLTENVEQINKEFEEINITPSEIAQFKEYVKHNDIFETFSKAIAPTLNGYDKVKEAITLQLFASDTTKNVDGTNNRGDIHILLLGDPGIGKSQILKSVVELVPRGIYTSGKSSSGAGLTAAAVKDENDGWTLEAGAMVLADKGFVCIDEFDKMREEDRSAIHEALEQQTISIAKAGTITTMFSRCSVLAAANPKYSSFQERKPIREQTNLTDALLSRFDLIFILEDKCDFDKDMQVAYSILDNVQYETESFEFQKYISYAREEIHPVESVAAREKLVKFYADWRKTASVNDDSNPVTARQFMGLKRLARASARARLSDVVTLEDVDRAISLEECCIQGNGYTVDESTGTMKMVDKFDALREKIPKLAIDYGDKIPSHILYKEGAACDISREDCKSWLLSLDDMGKLVYDPTDDCWSYRDYGKEK
jgi:replicative DNA helicase Mcm